jgi:hypothetical protein
MCIFFAKCGSRTYRRLAIYRRFIGDSRSIGDQLETRANFARIIRGIFAPLVEKSPEKG